MLRTCPRCGDFYADASLLFCLADGTPLVDVDSHGESWTEGARVVEEKERVIRKRTRRLRLRRVMLMTTTILITTAVVFVVAFNIYVYVAPKPAAPVAAATVTPTPTPTPTPQQCTARDKQRVQDSILAASSAELEQAVDKERDAIAQENLPDGAVNTSVTTLKPFTYSLKFSKACAPLSLKVTYKWVVKWGDSTKMGGGEKRVDVTKTFACKKDGAAWRCG